MSVRIKQQCSQKYCILLRMYCLFGAFIAISAAVVFGTSGQRIAAFLLGILSAAILGVFLTVPIYSGHISYTRIGGGLRIERGNLVKKIIVLNRRDIKSTQLSRTFMERRLGICTLAFTAPSGTIYLKGIDFDDGQRLKYLFGGDEE